MSESEIQERPQNGATAEDGGASGVDAGCLGVVMEDHNGVKILTRSCPEPPVTTADYGHEHNVPLCSAHSKISARQAIDDLIDAIAQQIEDEEATSDE